MQYQYGTLLLLCFGVTKTFANPVCSLWPDTQTVKATISSVAGACFTLEVKPGEPVELSIEQPVDLEFHLIGPGSETVIDAFEFGTETAAIASEGKYRVEIASVSKLQVPVEILMSRKPVSLQTATERRAAQKAGTQAKGSTKVSDYEISVELWNRLGDSSAAGRSNLKIARAAVSEGHVDLALGIFENALQLCDAAADLRCSAEAANNGGAMARRLGDFNEALHLLTTAVQDWNRLDETTLKGKTLSNLGLLFWQVGDYQQAISYNNQAKAILKTRDPLANARALNNLGLCYQYLGEYTKAMDHFNQALAEFERNKSAPDAARARLNLGRTHMLEGHNGVAMETLKQALSEAVAIADRGAQADILNNLGQTHLAVGFAAEARETLQRGLDLHTPLGDRRMQAADLHYLGQASAVMRDPIAARDYLNRAFTMRRDCGLRDPAAESLYALAMLERTTGHPDAAREFAEQALRFTEAVRTKVPGPSLRASYYARQRRIFGLLVDIEAAPENPRAAADSLLAAERGRARALLDLLAEGNLTALAPRDLLDRRRHIQRKLDLLSIGLSTALPQQATDLRRRVETLLSQDDEIEADIRQAATAHDLAKSPRSIAELQSQLPARSALVEYHLTETQSYLWLVDADDVRLFRLPSRAEIESQCEPVLRLFPAVLDRKRSPEKQLQFTLALRKLSGTLLGPLRTARLPARLIIVPDGVLTRIPFAALQRDSSGYLGLKHDLLQVPSASFLQFAKSPRHIREFPKAFLGIADPVYSSRDPRIKAGVQRTQSISTMARLPFVGEMDTIAQLIPSSRRRILTGFEASVPVVEGDRLEQYAVVHFSGHALIDDLTPELSRIALSTVDRSGRPADGYLRPYELSQLHLNGSVVVLSACDTALGKQVLGEGLAGFTTSLFSAGAAQLALTLAAIDAEASSEFMSKVYQHLFGTPAVSMEHAMALARAAMSRSQRWNDPFYWASFVLYGRPSD